jgi:hypothetical protein
VKGQTLLCRGCRVNELLLPIGDKAVNPDCFTCRACNGRKSMLDNMSREQIATAPLARQVARERALQRHGYLVLKRREDRDRKFLKRNGFTLEEWHKKVDALGWVCSFCRRELTKELRRDNTVLRWSTDGSKALDKTIPVCRACQCKKIGPLGAPH